MEAGLVRSTKLLPRPRRRHHLVPVGEGGDDRRTQPARGADDEDPHDAASRASSSSTTDGSSLVKIGVGFSTFAPTLDRAALPARRGGVVAGDDRVGQQPGAVVRVEVLDVVDARHRHVDRPRRRTPATPWLAECGRNGESSVLQSSTHWAATCSTVPSRSRWDSSFIL